jgi:hypothetical protein
MQKAKVLFFLLAIKNDQTRLEILENCHIIMYYILSSQEYVLNQCKRMK